MATLCTALWTLSLKQHWGTWNNQAAWNCTDRFPSLSWFWKAFTSRILSCTCKRYVDTPANRMKLKVSKPSLSSEVLPTPISLFHWRYSTWSQWDLISAESSHYILCSHPYMNKPLNFKMRKEYDLPSSSSRVTEGSTYSHQCFPSVDTGISQLDHLQAKWMHTHAITVGLYWRQNVVRWRLLHKFRSEEPKEIKHVKQKTQTNQPLTYRMRQLVNQQQLNILLNKFIRYLNCPKKTMGRAFIWWKSLIWFCYQKPDEQ